MQNGNAGAFFIEHKPLLFSLAYKMTGSVDDAWDIVQDTFMKWSDVSTAQIEHPKAYLVKILTNTCLNFLQSAQKQRTTYWGVWLPEPLTSLTTMPEAENFDEHTTLSLGILRLLEALTPQERAVFLLAEVFEDKYRTVAELLDISESNCRKLKERAQAKLRAGKKRFTATKERHEQLFGAFLQAVSEGDTTTLRQLLKEDAVLYSDGGGKVTAARVPVVGSEKIIQGLFNIIQWSQQHEPSVYELCMVNGKSGIVGFHRDSRTPHTVMTIEADAEGITELYSVRNPDKIRRLRLFHGA